MNKEQFYSIRKIEEYGHGELVNAVLKVAAVGLIAGTSVVAPNVVQVIDLFDPKGQIERRRVWRTIRYLEERNTITIRREAGADVIYLTRLGKVRLDEESVWNITITKPRWWDHKWRLVMFDFPKYYEKSRHPFRSKLVDLGFRQYQKSVLICPYECQEEVNAIAEMYGVHTFIRYIVAEEVTGMRELIQEFDLV